MKTLLVSLLFCLTLGIHAQTPEDRIRDLRLEIPEMKTPVANFVKWRRIGNLVYLSGHGSLLKGKLGEDLSVEEGYQAARQTGLEILGSLRNACEGDLNKVHQFVKVLGMVQSSPSFYDQPKVINGFSDLMTEVFGEAGKHARSAVGMAALPNNIAVEIEVIVELKPE